MFVRALNISGPFSGDQVIFWSNITQLSTPHPPGYIWHSLLAYFGQGLPAPFLILIVQLASALLSLVCLNRALNSLKVHSSIQFLIPFCWLLSFGVFRYFLIYENKALALAFVCLYLLAMVRFLAKPGWKTKYFLLLSFVLAGSQHHLMYVLLAPSLLYLMATYESSWGKALIQIIGACLLSLTPYFLLEFVTQSHLENMYSWGNIQSLPGLFTHWSRSEFGIFSLAEIRGPSRFSAMANHLYELVLFLIKSTYGCVLLLLPVFKNLPEELPENFPKVFRILSWSLFFYFTFFILFGSLNPNDSWYHALLVRFWILPSPFLFVLIALRLNQLSKKWRGSLWVPALILTASLMIYLPSELKLSQNKIYALHSEIIANESPAHSLVLHSEWLEWMRTTLIFNQRQPLAYTNPLNQTLHVSYKSLFQTGWPQEQFLAQLKRENITIQEHPAGELYQKFLQSLRPPYILLVGPKNAEELGTFTRAFKFEAEAIGPYFLLEPQSSSHVNIHQLDKKILKTFRENGIKQCTRLFEELEENPLDRWIEPVTDYFCYPCFLSYQRENIPLKDPWKQICNLEQGARL